MKIPLSWLREFVDVPGSPEEIAATMSVRGFAVEGIERLDDEVVIDFEITANRPDCMSVIGIAREVATAYGLQVRRPVVRGRAPVVERKQEPAETADAADSAGTGAGSAPGPGSQAA